MTQPDLLSFALQPSAPSHRRPRVRQTSKLAVTVMRDSGTLQQRASDICHWLAWHANAQNAPPTSAELATWLAFNCKVLAPSQQPESRNRFARLDKTAQKNYIARGMWDAQQAAMVEAVPHGDRTCTVNKRKACTWRLRTV